jgi:hypothetical protein
MKQGTWMTQNLDEKDDLITLSQAAKMCNVGIQAIYVAIRKGRLPGIKKKNKWFVSEHDLQTYRGNRYSRQNRIFNGEKVYDMQKGPFSLLHVAQLLSQALNEPYHPQRLYHLLRIGSLKGYKVGAAWAIAKEDAMALIEKEIQNQKYYISQIIS